MRSPSPHVSGRPSRPRLYRGWLVLAGGFTTTMLVTGLTFYSFGLYVVPIAQEFGLSRAEANNGIIAFVLGTALWGPVIGRVVDRVSSQAVIAAGGVLFAAAFVMIALAKDLWLIGLAALVPLALSLQCAGALVASAVAARWFEKRRGRAMGVIAAASALGGVLFVPIDAWLIEAVGWRAMFAIVGLSTGVLTLAIAFFMIRSHPDDGERAAAGEAHEDSGSAQAPTTWRVLSIRELYLSPRFWIVVGGFGLIGCTVQAVLATVTPFLHDGGLDLKTAGLIMSVLTAAAVVGKFGTGYLTESISVNKLVIASSALQAACYIVLLFELPFALLIVTLAALGLGLGAFQPLITMAYVRHFGPASLGSVMGGGSPVMQIMAILALRFAGVTFDRSGSYNITFIAFAVALMLGTLLVVSIKPPASPAAGPSLPKLKTDAAAA